MCFRVLAVRPQRTQGLELPAAVALGSGALSMTTECVGTVTAPVAGIGVATTRCVFSIVVFASICAVVVSFALIFVLRFLLYGLAARQLFP